MCMYTVCIKVCAVGMCVRIYVIYAVCSVCDCLRILSSSNPVGESVTILCELLQEILRQTGGSGILL